MRIEAAVVAERSGRFLIETLELDDPAPDEVLVRVAACGICQTDVHGRDGYFGLPFPAVFGHEGAGVVEAVGAAVRSVAPGDHVVLCFPSCGRCPRCAGAQPAYCRDARRLKMSGTRADGSPTMRRRGQPVSAAFFQQSSFATHALATDRNVVRVPADVPAETLAAFPCGVNTGAGAVMNVLGPRPGEAFAVFGAGAVGLAGLMAARLAGCDPIIAVDVHNGRLALARELGATHTVLGGGGVTVEAVRGGDPSSAEAIRPAAGSPSPVDATRTPTGTASPVEAIRAATRGEGAAHTLDATGDPHAARQAIEALAPRGVCCLVGSARTGVDASFEMSLLQNGRAVRGCVQGDSVPQQFVPRLIELWRAGRLPVDRLVRTYPFAAIDEALADASAGRTVKPVLRLPG